jgi:hypothetical protein
MEEDLMKLKGYLALPVSVMVFVTLSGLGPLYAESRFPDVRRVVRKGGGLIDEMRGVLIADPATRQLRFAGHDQALLEVDYDRITSMHYETDTKRPRALLDQQIGHYVTLHYADAAGQARFAIFRLPSRDIRSTLESLEADLGLKINTTPPKRSFQGLPIRVAAGDTVAVTDETCRTTQGKITSLSASSLVLDGATRAEHEFQATTIRRISVVSQPGRDARSGLKWWAGIGGLVGGVYGGALSGVSGVLEGAAVFGALWSAIGAGLGSAAGTAADLDIYLGPP